MEKEDRERLAKQVGKIAEEVFLLISANKNSTERLSLDISGFGRSVIFRISDGDTAETIKKEEVFGIPYSSFKEVADILSLIEKEIENYKISAL